MVTLTEKRRILNWIDTTLKNFQSGKIEKEDMEHLAKPKYQKQLQDRGYGYLHDFAKAYVSESTKDPSKQKYHGQKRIDAKLSQFLQEKYPPEYIFESFSKGQFKSIHTDARPISVLPSITMASASTYAKSQESIGRAGVMMPVIETAIETNPDIAKEQIEEFATNYPLLAGIIAKKDPIKGELPNVISYGSTDEGKAIQEFQQLNFLHSAIKEAAFSNHSEGESKKAVLNKLNKEAHTLYNGGALGLPKRKEPLRTTLTEAQKEKLKSEISQEWKKIKATQRQKLSPEVDKAEKSLQAQGISAGALLKAKELAANAASTMRRRSGAIAQSSLKRSLSKSSQPKDTKNSKKRPIGIGTTESRI